ncbi:MAG: hypothetical protein WBF93_00960 [Pirellulales bacterium]
MSDQAAPLYQLALQANAQPADPAQGRGVIVVVGSRPGVGATTIAVNLAQRLSDLGQAIVVVDAEIGKPDATRCLGLDPQGAFVDLICGDSATCDAVYPLPNGMAVIGGSVDRIHRDVDTQSVSSRLTEAIRWLGRYFDWALFDGGHFDQPLTNQIGQHATHVLLVVDDQTDAVDAYTTLKCLVRRDMAPSAHTVMMLFNRTIVTDDAKAKYRGIVRTARRYLDIDIPLAGYVYENENPSHLLAQLAQTISGTSTATSNGKKGFHNSTRDVRRPIDQRNTGTSMGVKMREIGQD